MKLVVGLGNPGEKYKKTRHNIGFMVLDKLVTSDQVTPQQSSGQASNKEWQLSKNANAQYIKPDSKIEFLKPQTFMNLSGQAVQYAMQKNKVKIQDVLVICDDLDLPLGTIRIRLKGSGGGHKGLESIIDQIGDKFARIRIGIGSNYDQGVLSEDYVLQNFTKDEYEIINKSIDKSVEILLEWINGKELTEVTIKLT